VPPELGTRHATAQEAPQGEYVALQNTPYWLIGTIQALKLICTLVDAILRHFPVDTPNPGILSRDRLHRIRAEARTLEDELTEEEMKSNVPPHSTAT